MVHYVWIDKQRETVPAYDTVDEVSSMPLSQHPTMKARERSSIFLTDRKLFHDLVVNKKAFTSSASYSVAPLLEPPIRNGMMYCFITLSNIVSTVYPETKDILRVSDCANISCNTIKFIYFHDRSLLFWIESRP